NTAFDPVSAGNTTIALVQPAGFSVPANQNSSIVATVTGAIPTGQVNLTQTVVTTASASTIFNSAYPASYAIDGLSGTGSSWCTANNDPSPSLTIDFGEDTTVSSLIIVEYSAGSTTYDFLTGRFRLFNAALTQVYDSGVVALSGGNIDLDVNPDVSGVRRVVFEGVTWNSIEPCLSELAVVGTAP
ncbi:MAG: discoidin domain-containing protein, partial [Gammaproteobacteria bacterium]|nr:discoidin domain-containing protein [Gammaproteobacteria bacterium]